VIYCIHLLIPHRAEKNTRSVSKPKNMKVSKRGRSMEDLLNFFALFFFFTNYLLAFK
jgi:hypothetical protein